MLLLTTQRLLGGCIGPKDIFSVPATSNQELGTEFKDIKPFNLEGRKPRVHTEITMYFDPFHLNEIIPIVSLKKASLATFKLGDFGFSNLCGVFIWDIVDHFQDFRIKRATHRHTQRTCCLVLMPIKPLLFGFIMSCSCLLGVTNFIFTNFLKFELNLSGSKFEGWGRGNEN